MNTTEFVRFLDAGITSRHVAGQVAARFDELGFFKLDRGDEWILKPGAGYVLRRGGTILAWRMGTAAPYESGATILAAHTDSPALQLKPASAKIEDGQIMVPVEVYGGPIRRTWLDRDLLVAGRVATVDDQGRAATVTVNTRRPVGIIPSLAIHLDKKVNEGQELNQQSHLRVLFGPPAEGTAPSSAGSGAGPSPFNDAGQPGSDIPGNAQGSKVSAATRAFYRLLQEYAEFDPERVVDSELLVVPVQPAATFGADDGLVASPRIDNLAGCFSVMQALATAKPVEHTQVALFFDHEEIGSRTTMGAASHLIAETLRRIANCTNYNSKAPAFDAYDRMLARTVLVSNDGAHARHPSYSDRHDDGYAPKLGGGPAVKKSAIRRYATELPVTAWVFAAAKRIGVDVQILQNRSDLPAGSTIGPALASILSVISIDIGIPMLSMHSTRETAAIADIDGMTRLLVEVMEARYDQIPDAD